MAKGKRKPSKPKASRPSKSEEEEPEVVEGEEVSSEYEEEEEEYDSEAKAKEEEPAAKPRDFFSSIGEGLKAAGQVAERYARVGVSTVELEKMRVELKLAHAKLGESVIHCWDDAPDIGVGPDDPAVKGPYRKIKELRRRIREIENKIRNLHQGKKSAE